jgi:hypothetical protein
MRRLAIVAAVTLALPVVAACGASSAPKSTEAFCSRLSELRDSDPITDAATSEQAADQAASILDDLIRTAPQQIKGDLRTFRRLVDDLRKVDQSDPAAASAAVQKLTTAEVISAGQSLSAFAADQCGFSELFGTNS